MFSLLGMVVFLISIEGAGVSMHVEPVKIKKDTVWVISAIVAHYLSVQFFKAQFD